MAARSRGLVSTIPPSHERHRNTELPDYEPSHFALDSDAQRKLRNVVAKLQLDNLNRDLSASILRLTNGAADINDRAVEQRERLARQRARAEREDAAGSQNDGDREARSSAQASASVSGESLDQKVGEMTEVMERAVRKLLDSQQELIMLKDSLSSAEVHAADYASTQASLPAASRVQRSSQHQPRADEDDEDDGEDRDEYDEIEPTAPDQNTPQIVGPAAILKDQVRVRNELYHGQSLAQRYASSNSYCNFRRVVHAARNPEAGELSVSDMFKERPPARPGVTQLGGEDGDVDEEDIQMTRAITSTKCPITLQEFKQPLTSNKCPHTYEASAIREMIGTSSNRLHTEQGPRTGVRAVQCPVQGCMNTLTLADLHEDMVIMRRIKRLQRNRELQEQEMQDGANRAADGTQGGALLVDDDHDDELGIDDIEDDEQPMPSKRVKREARSSMR